MRVSYSQEASDDLVRQFRYYLVNLDLPEVATRFRAAIRLTIQTLRLRPLIGPRYQSRNPRLQELRSWPVTGFEVLRIYYQPEKENIRVIRILHGKRDIQNIIETEHPSWQ